MLENGRVMPEPAGGQSIKWIPQTPTFKFYNLPAQFKGPAGKAKAFSVDLEVLYGYGEAGYVGAPAVLLMCSRTVDSTHGKHPFY